MTDTIPPSACHLKLAEALASSIGYSKDSAGWDIVVRDLAAVLAAGGLVRHQEKK